MDTHENTYKILEQLKHQPGFSAGFGFFVPSGYFESVTDTVLKKIRVEQMLFEELAETAPLLNEISKQMPFKTPDFYFSQKRNFRPTSGLVVNFKKAMAIAASIIAITILSIFLLTQKITGNQQEASLNRVEPALNSLSSEQLQQFLQSEPNPTAEIKTTAIKTAEKTIDVVSLLKDVPDYELTNFLEETADGSEDLLFN